MNSCLHRFVMTAFVLAALLATGTAWAHPGPAHIHEGPGMVLHHDNHSPFGKHDHPVQTKNDDRSLHCVLNGHDASQPCPHMKSDSTRQDGVVRIGLDCGGQTSPDGKSVVKTGTSFYGVVTTPEETACTSQELFPAIHPMLSRSPDEIAPPPKRALHSN